ncbi:hypothetical protein HCN51_51300 [Nonomuraea sp. FMUSA5-5]|uniref:Uncharacterized protein n=1 Tax=Nonomuraea composti TaxID=2720023 RepID=A0ABX1BSL4_9ACTN|nr:hypothetical protein [Nonomuraea sp. FMUSA5-5]NJP97723.1 hypothetical protein [Nonomuraea sp. FMUSA5-5]
MVLEPHLDDGQVVAHDQQLDLFRESVPVDHIAGAAVELEERLSVSPDVR